MAKINYVNRIINIIIIGLIVMVAIFFISNALYKKDLPTMNDIYQDSLYSSTLVSAHTVVCIEQYFDVDAIIYGYETQMIRDDDFFKKASAQLPKDQWQRPENNQDYNYVSFVPKSGFGELRIYKRTNRKEVLVGIWTNSTDQSEFAQRYLWSRIQSELLSIPSENSKATKEGYGAR